MKSPIVPWLAAALLLVLVLGGLGARIVAPTLPITRSPSIGGSFTLIDAVHNTPLTERSFEGGYHLVYFGFTHCPDICPTTLMTVAQMLEENPALAATITPVFVTLDPARDGVKEVADYVRHFGDNMIGLTGTETDIAHIAKAYHVYYKKVPLPDSALGYTIDHSGYLYLMGPQGEYITHFAYGVSVGKLQERLAKLLAAR